MSSCEATQLTLRTCPRQAKIMFTLYVLSKKKANGPKKNLKTSTFSCQHSGQVAVAAVRARVLLCKVRRMMLLPTSRTRTIVASR